MTLKQGFPLYLDAVWPVVGCWFYTYFVGTVAATVCVLVGIAVVAVVAWK